MKRIILALWLAIAPAWADGVAVPGIPSIGQVGSAVSYPPSSGGGGYTGPGDAVSGAVAWWGLRCYNNAYSGPVADITDASTGNTTGTRLQCLSGTLVSLSSGSACTFVTGNACSPLATTCATSCNIEELYDQSGANSCSAAPCNLIQATNSKRPALTQSCLGGRPCMTFTGSSSQELPISGLANPLFSQPYVISSVAERTGSPFVNQVIIANAASPFYAMEWDFTANHIAISSPNLVTTTATDSAFHAFQGLFNSTTSSIMVDGTNTTGLNPGTNPINTLITMGGSNFLTGQIAEVGIWNSALNSTQLNALNSNQHGPSGYSF